MFDVGSSFFDMFALDEPKSLVDVSNAAEIRLAFVLKINRRSTTHMFTAATVMIMNDVHL